MNLELSGGNIELSKRTLDDLVNIMAKLRGNPGCPWDMSQTHETLKPFLVEEAYEVIDAIDKAMKLEEPGNGILFAVDVNKTSGLYEG